MVEFCIKKRLEFILNSVIDIKLYV